MKKKIKEWIKHEFAFIQGNILVIIVGSIFTSFTESIVNPFRSLYIRELGASPTIFGFMNSIGRVVHAIVRLPGGHIADKYGRKKIIYTLTFGIALSNLFYAIAPSWKFIAVAIIIANISAMYYPAFAALEVDSISPEDRGRGFATIGLLPKILAVFSPAIGGFLVDRLGLIQGMRIAYIFVTLAVLFTATLRLFYLEETLENPRDFDFKELRDDIVTSITSIKETWNDLSRNLKAFILVMTMNAFGGPFGYLFYALYAFDVIGVTSIEWGVIGSVQLATFIIFGYFGGKFVDKFGRLRSALLSFMLWVPILLWYVFARDFVTVLLISFLMSITDTVWNPAFMSLRGDLVPRKSRGRVMALFGVMMNLAQIPSTAIAGVLYQWNPKSPFLVHLILCVITITMFFLYVKEPEKREI